MPRNAARQKPVAAEMRGVVKESRLVQTRSKAWFERTY